MFTRVLDVTIVLLLAIIVVLPRPDARAKPAAELRDPELRTRVAELQAELLASPGALEPTLALSELFFDAQRPEWALAALGAALERAPLDHRLHHRRALALADHFAGAAAHDAAARALALCESGSTAPCSGGDRARIELLVTTLARVKDLDWRKDPNAVKTNVIKALRPTYLPPPRGQGGAARAGAGPRSAPAAGASGQAPRP